MIPQELDYTNMVPSHKDATATDTAHASAKEIRYLLGRLVASSGVSAGDRGAVDVVFTSDSMPGWLLSSQAQLSFANDDPFAELCQPWKSTYKVWRLHTPSTFDVQHLYSGLGRQLLSSGHPTVPGT